LQPLSLELITEPELLADLPTHLVSHATPHVRSLLRLRHGRKAADQPARRHVLLYSAPSVERLPDPLSLQACSPRSDVLGAERVSLRPPGELLPQELD
tara:strand:+ start:345 stop:638 length:294 start_codon:yes stop_codon:yes gene_type:complete